LTTYLRIPRILLQLCMFLVGAASYPDISVYGDVLACVAPTLTSDCLMRGRSGNLELCTVERQAPVLREITRMLSNVRGEEAAVYKHLSDSHSSIVTLKRVSHRARENAASNPSPRSTSVHPIALETVVQTLINREDHEVDPRCPPRKKARTGCSDSWSSFRIEPRAIEEMVKRETAMTSGIRRKSAKFANKS